MPDTATSPAPKLTPEMRLRAEAARLELCIRQARRGDVLPLVRLQWGSHLILDAGQLDLLENCFNPEIYDVWVKGATGTGKSTASAMVVCLFYQIYLDAKVILTRDSHKRAVALLFGEVSKWFKAMRYPPRANVLGDRIIDPENEQHAVQVVNPLYPEGFQGAHSPHLLILFDEATADILEPRFDAAFTQATKFLALGNPRTSGGHFRSAFPRGNPNESQTVRGPYGLRRLITIRGEDCMNVRLRRLEKPIAPEGGMQINGRLYAAGESITAQDYEQVKPIIPGQTCYDQYLGHLKNPNPDWVKIFAHGFFPDSDPELRLFSHSWFEPCVRRQQHIIRLRERFLKGTTKRVIERHFPITAFGLDVAASTSQDWSVLTAGGPWGMLPQRRKQLADTTAVVSWVVATCRELYGVDLTAGGHPIGVDVVGVGKGVGDMLARLGCSVVEIRGNDTSDVDPKVYSNKRTEAYGEAAHRLNPEGDFAADPFALEESPLLSEELCAHEKVFIGADGIRFKLPPKEKVPGIQSEKEVVTIKERIGRSPDHSDSFVYFYRALQAVGYDFHRILDSTEFF